MQTEPGYEQNIPCPLCGSPPIISHSGSTDFVWCSNPICYLHKCEGTMLLSQWNKRVPGAQPLEHLGDVLYMLAELHPDDQCQAYVDALTFYNNACPDKQISPVEGYTKRIVTTRALDRATDAPATLTEVEKEAAVDALYSGYDNMAPLRWDALEDSLNALLERFEVRPKP